MPNLIGGIVLGYIWQILINCVLTLMEQPLLALNTTAGYWGIKEARINTLSTLGGNWTWRMSADALSSGLAEKIRRMTLVYGR